MMGMRKKPAVPLTQKFPKAEPLALKLLERLLAFDPKDRLSAEEVRTRQPLTLLINYIYASFNVIKLHFIFFPDVHKKVLPLSLPNMSLLVSSIEYVKGSYQTAYMLYKDIMVICAL
jgi:serine/threonine protein kinase